MKFTIAALALTFLFAGCTPPKAAEEDTCTSTVVVGTCPTSNVGYGVDYQGKLVCFSLSTPQTLAASTVITGLTVGDVITQLDFRPANSVLYALGASGQLYTLNTSTAVATAVGTPMALTGTPNLVMDINPEVDRIRLVTDANENRRYNPATGALVATDTALAYNVSDLNAGSTPAISALAYSNNVASGTPTVLYGIDSGLRTLVTIDPANAGTVNTVAALGFTPSDISGFDIRTAASVDSAYAIALWGALGMRSALYTVNLSNGASTQVGTIGGCRIWGFAVGL